MSQIKLVSVHALGQGILWHSVRVGYRHTMSDPCTEDYFERLFWHFMRSPRELVRPQLLHCGSLRPVWSGARAQHGESFLLSCHLLYYQDWLLCFVAYLHVRGEPVRASAPVNSGLRSFLWACCTHLSAPVLG